MPRLLKPPQHDQPGQAADVQAVGRGIEADVDGPRPLGEPGAQPRVVGRLVNQAAPLEIGEQIVGGRFASASRSRGSL